MTSQRTRDRLIDRLRDKGVGNEHVLAVMREVPRHLFIDEAMSSRAYEDTALPIGEGQTISQPYVVARMTEALIRDRVPSKVLEVGTGSGYQAGVLSRLVERVYSVERIKRLIDTARQRFANLKYNNIQLRYADGEMGWPQQGPYDGIMITAAPEEVPQALLEQLADPGVMIIPVGEQGASQKLLRITREAGELKREFLDLVSFVPFLTGRS